MDARVIGWFIGVFTGLPRDEAHSRPEVQVLQGRICAFIEIRQRVTQSARLLLSLLIPFVQDKGGERPVFAIMVTFCS